MAVATTKQPRSNAAAGCMATGRHGEPKLDCARGPLSGATGCNDRELTRSGRPLVLGPVDTTLHEHLDVTGCPLEQQNDRAPKFPLFLSAQRTAVKQRPHQETGRQQVAMTEPVVLHHGRKGGCDGRDEVRPSAFNGLLGGPR